AVAGPDVRLEAVELPEIASLGEVSTLVARLAAGRPTGATLRVLRDDELVAERDVELRSGYQEVALPVPVGGPGLHRYRIDVSAADPAADTLTANNVLGAVQRVVGPPRVLIIAGSPSAPGSLP